MIVTLILVCEVGFWVLLAGGLSLRYLARMPRTGIAVLLLEPVLELVLLIATAVDLRNGASADWKHGLAAVYIGYSVGLGHSTITWVDQRFAHRFAGGPPPVKPPKHGAARTAYEWKVAGRWILAAAVAAALLQAAVWYVGDSGDVSSLRAWQTKMLIVVGINLAIAVSYTIWPKQPKDKGEDGDPDGAVPDLVKRR
ncbi:hypothetical protein BLA24_24385 [Streptomyces cinnamoneus]|uniref:Uncharacterized protein n=1 Tax=Streptomyces cinnamoneus TaxID=53446 RepID=A0A2G1XD95_STRCJ|nr:hypothetical protein [Streptomyces cinnamoneus]PHQ49208.1 hypothetical protein BLA24_24385 [Streptomyces cinnamoneus]PPT15142.1 hypothetical protein CYQ11_21685 [Streptomyces cinnamoneus]